ncbi:MAG: Na+/H+ antiporter NhaA [Xanthomonadales bacterium]|nr:Na+/H+ antiporter NhaA [Xanthomonadales bacterium]NNL94255.1 Na+/H+ antiporter NhaA [Xanthomonadales bacterium]
MIPSMINDFLKKESSGGLLLIFAAIVALIFANSPYSGIYDMMLDVPVVVQIGELVIAKPLLLWINDGLMALFFLLVGLELKREMIEGELSDLSKIALPAIGAVGGMAIPAAIYLYLNWHDPVARQGWAIPAATDIAFALGILSLLGSRVPLSIKVFLTSLAIFDDIGAIVIIALFYTDNLSVFSLLVAAACTGLLLTVNRKGVESRSVYLGIGLVMWVALLKSGVHATLAGVVLAVFIPIKSKDPDDPAPLKALEHDLHSLVAFVVLPVFAFANAGVTLAGVSPSYLLHDVPLGIALGLFVGKQIGVFGLCWLAVKMGLAKLPHGMNSASLYGTSLLCGVGFTMSLFIGSLAFEQTQVNLLFDERLGIILGSALSGLGGYLVLRWALPARGNVSGRASSTS